MLETASALQGAAHTQSKGGGGANVYLSLFFPRPPPPTTSVFIEGRGMGLWKRWSLSIYRHPDAPAVSLTYNCPDSSVHKMNNLPKSTCNYLYLIHYNELRQFIITYPDSACSPTVNLGGRSLFLLDTWPNQGLRWLRCTWEKEMGRPRPTDGWQGQCRVKC